MKTSAVQLSKIMFCLLFGALATGCNSNYVTSASVNAFTQGGDQYGQLTLGINPQSLTLPAVNLTIVDPKNPAKTYGTVVLTDGTTTDTLTMTVDMTASAGLQAGTNDTVLPNGQAVPFTEIDTPQELTFGYGGGSVANSKAYVLLDSSTKTAAFGTALAISEFNVGQQGYVFVPFTVNGVTGTAGVFTGTTAGTSGFAVFADVSSLLTSVGTLDMFSMPDLNAKPAASHSVQYSSVEDAQRIEKMLERLNRDHTKLTIAP